MIMMEKIMSKKKSELDILGESHLPSDLLTPSLGSSYLVGEDPTLEYGMGTLDAVVNPEFHKAPALPTGLNREGSERLDLQEYLLTPEITDLSWLDPSQMQDPSRLPKDPHEVLPELEELWGSVTDGQTIQKNSVDLEKLRYEQSLNSREVPVKKFSQRTFEKIVTAAMRRSAMGQNILTVIRETLESVGDDYRRYIPAMKMVRAEHGLNGNVYIRKASFPNFESGKWNAHIKKYHSGAQYIIVSKEDFGKTFIENGRCRYTGKKAVLEVPWDSAYNYYAPRLQSTGHKLASGNKRQVLKNAFLTGPEETVIESNLPVNQNPADRVSLKQAHQEFNEYKPERKVYDPTDARMQKLHIAIERKLNQMVRDLGLPRKAATEILNSGAHPRDMLKTASAIVVRVKTGEYSGENNYGNKEAERSLRTTADLTGRSSEIEKSKRETRVASLMGKVKVAVSKGLRGETLYQEITRIFPAEDLPFAQKQLSAYLLKSGALKETIEEDVTYDGDGVGKTLAPRFASKISKVVSPKVASALSWVRRSMSEGFAGNELDSLISSRFANEMLSNINEGLKEVREKHEGASGFLYVDASAYATETGSKGCEKASTRHRVNGIPAVAAMSRCGSCVHNKVAEDGTPRCGIFNKTLLFDVDIPTEIKQKNIDSTNMTDAEVTASLFSSVGADIYDPAEFGLRNSNLEEIEFENMPETEKISKILFDGWDID